MNPREELLEKVIDLIYGVYDPQTLSEEQQQQYTALLKERLIKWKIDPGLRKILGPLQPPQILSKMAKVPVEIVEQIAKDLHLNLPVSADMSDFNIEKISDDQVLKLLNDLNDSDSANVEQNILEALTTVENLIEKNTFNPKAFQYLDASHEDISFGENDVLPNTFYMIKYLEGIIAKIKTGEVKIFSIISILNDDKASVYLPPSMTHEMDLFRPIIDLLMQESTKTNIN